MLIENGADVNVADFEGHTALHTAFAERQSEIADVRACTLACAVAVVLLCAFVRCCWNCAHLCHGTVIVDSPLRCILHDQYNPIAPI